MTAKITAVLDPLNIGAHLELQQGGTVVTFDTDSTDVHRHVRSTIGKTEGVWSFEGAFWTTSTGTLASHAVIGVATAAADLAKYVGEDAEGFGYKLGDGDIFNNDASVATVAPTSLKVFVSVVVDLDASPQTVSWFVNGSLVATVNLPSGETWYPAVTVAGAVAYDLSAFLNFGQRAPAFDVVDNFGWYSVTGGYPAMYLCAVEDRGYISSFGDADPNRIYLPRIINAKQFSIERKASVWPWDDQNDGSTFANLELRNDDGYFDALPFADVRDSLVTIKLVEAGGSLDDAIVVATGIVDSVTASGESKIVISIKDTLAELDRPVQNKLRPPFVDPGVANRPWPIALGAVRNIDLGAQLSDSENRIFDVADDAITNVGVVRDKGDPLDPTATPPQYNLTGDLNQLQLLTLPDGKLTADVSNEGAQIIIPPLQDVLAGDGTFTTWPSSGSPPTNWTTGGGGSLFRLGTAQGEPQDYVASLDATDAWWPTSGDYGFWMRHNTADLQAGKTYRVTMKLRHTGGGPPATTIGMGAGVMLIAKAATSLSGTIGSSDFISPYNAPLQSPTIGAETVYTFIYTVPAGSDRYLYAVAVAAQGATGGTTTGPGGGNFYDIKAEELIVLPETELQGITLTEYFRTIIEGKNHGNLPSTAWVSADTEAIDADAPYLFGVYIVEQMSVIDALRLPLDSFCATLFTDELGRIRVRRLVDPETVDDADVVASYDKSNIGRPMAVRADEAKFLSTQMGSRRDWYVFQDTDFATSYIDVPAALRTQFKRTSQFIETSAEPLAGMYQAAVNQAPMNSLLDSRGDARAEITRVNKFYSATRPRLPVFAVFTTQFTPQEGVPFHLFADAIFVKYDRFGFSARRKLAVAGTKLFPRSGLQQLTSWG